MNTPFKLRKYKHQLHSIQNIDHEDFSNAFTNYWRFLYPISCLVVVDDDITVLTQTCLLIKCSMISNSFDRRHNSVLFMFIYTLLVIHAAIQMVLFRKSRDTLS